VQRSGRRVGEFPTLDRLGPGSHVCCVTDSSTPFEQWAAACLTEGAAIGEKLFRFAPQAALAAVRRHTPGELAVTVVDPREAFLAGGPVDADVMYSVFRRQAAVARAEGYRGLRLVADMDWLLAVPPSREELTDFEVLLDEVVTELAVTVVCVYRTEHFDALTVAEQVAIHPVTVGTAPTQPGFRLWNVTGGLWELMGEVDSFNAEPFGRALAAAASRTPQLRLKTARLRFIAVAGVRAIVQLALSRPDLQLLIEDATEPLRLCWTLLGLDRHLPHVRIQPSPAGHPLPSAAPPSAARSEGDR
jgi:hypothetical protein